MCYDSLLGTGGRVDRLVWYTSSVQPQGVRRGLLEVPLWCGHQLCPRAKMDAISASNEGGSPSLGPQLYWWDLTACWAHTLSRDTRIERASLFGKIPRDHSSAINRGPSSSS